MMKKKDEQHDVSEGQHKAALARIRKLERRLDALIHQIGGAMSFTYADPEDEDADA